MIDDEKIIEMFFERSEQGIRELDIKYGKVCHNLSYHIVGSRQDAEECVNDAYTLYCREWLQFLILLVEEFGCFLSLPERSSWKPWNGSAAGLQNYKTFMDNVSKLYEELISFSDLYDSASFEAKKMIVNQLIRRVDVYRGYQLNITFNFDLTPYIEGDDAAAC